MAAVDGPQQILGHALTIGCVALEITQRCNLDCTLCYLSEHSEHVADVPLEEVLRRLDTIRATYGPCTSVQITGGDPTLRKLTELEEIVRYAHSLDLFPALFTNGIAASRKLLQRLAAVGLRDVAFHVDTTQQRPGGATEAALNTVRDEYIERARGLGLMVIFNTTVHAGNVAELPALIRFFMRRARDVGLVSFQLQAATGRGVWGERAADVSLEGIRRTIETTGGQALPWDTIRIGHPHCHSYLPAWVIGDTLAPIARDAVLVGDFVRDFSGAHADRREGWRQVAWQYLRAAARRPRWLWRAAAEIADQIWCTRGALWRARGRVHQLSFFVHNFMDAAALEPERVNACSFMVMTHEGPVSMCEHNARRDEFILKPLHFRRADGSLGDYQPLQKAGRARVSA